MTYSEISINLKHKLRIWIEKDVYFILIFGIMKNTVFVKHVLPFVHWFLLMIIVALFIDFAFHQMDVVFIGRYLGWIGTGLIIFSFVYSLKKRKLIDYGSPKTLLSRHEQLSWLGSVLLLVHAGIHFNAVLPWLAIVLMVVTVGSGLVGKYLLKKSNESLNAKKQALRSEGLSAEEADKKVFFDAVAVDLMKKWRVVHMPITLLFGVLALLHILTILIFAV